MPEVIKQHASAISELTGAQAVQAMLTMIVTVTIMILLVLDRDVPQFLLLAFFTLLGIYMELPKNRVPVIEGVRK